MVAPSSITLGKSFLSPLTGVDVMVFGQPFNSMRPSSFPVVIGQLATYYDPVTQTTQTDTFDAAGIYPGMEICAMVIKFDTMPAAQNVTMRWYRLEDNVKMWETTYATGVSPGPYDVWAYIGYAPYEIAGLPYYHPNGYWMPYDPATRIWRPNYKVVVTTDGYTFEKSFTVVNSRRVLCNRYGKNRYDNTQLAFQIITNTTNTTVKGGSPYGNYFTVRLDVTSSAGSVYSDSLYNYIGGNALRSDYFFPYFDYTKYMNTNGQIIARVIDPNGLEIARDTQDCSFY